MHGLSFFAKLTGAMILTISAQCHAVAQSTIKIPKPEIIKKFDQEIIDLTYSKSAKQFAVTTFDGKKYLYDSAWKQVWSEENNGVFGYGGGAVFSPDGRHLVLSSYGKMYRSAVLDLKTLKIVTILEKHSFYIMDAKFSPDGKWLFTVCNGGVVHVWDPSDGYSHDRALQRFEGGGTSLAVSPDSQLVAAGDGFGKIHVWRIPDDLKAVKEFQAHLGTLHSMAFSQKKGHLISTGGDYKVRIWSRKDQFSPVAVLTGHTFNVTCVAVSEDENLFATGCFNGWVNVWKNEKPFSLLATCNEKMRKGGKAAYSCLFRNNTTIIEIGQHREIHRWHLPISAKGEN